MIDRNRLQRIYLGTVFRSRVLRLIFLLGMHSDESDMLKEHQLESRFGSFIRCETTSTQHKVSLYLLDSKILIILNLHRIMLGAGDIKLMSLCTGILGVWDGFFVIFLGLFLAAAGGAFVLCSEGILWERLERLSGFVIRWGRDGKLREYPAEAGKERMIRLGPYLFLGYCIWLTFKACG